MTEGSSPNVAQKPSRELVVFSDAAAVARAAADRVEISAREAVKARGSFRLVLAGGSTPRALYTELALRPGLPWDRTDFFFGDERLVPPEHAESNARMAHEALLRCAFVDPRRVHRMEGERPPLEAAARYEQVLREHFSEQALPRFDLVLLGLGTDGHTASLFPHSPALAETERWVTAAFAPALGVERLTLTLPVLNAARHVLFLIAGEDKARALQALLSNEGSPDDVPARAIWPERGTCALFVDEGAAVLTSRLDRAGGGASAS